VAVYSRDRTLAIRCGSLLEPLNQCVLVTVEETRDQATREEISLVPRPPVSRALSFSPVTAAHMC